MTNDLISRSALLDAMPKDDELFSLDVRRVILNAPTVDAAPAVEGEQSEWIEVPNYSYSWDEITRRTICPRCGGKVKWHAGEEHRYCYHCGAQMKSGGK